MSGTWLTMGVDNTIICAEQPASELHLIAFHKMASISPYATQGLPREFLNCILGISAVHYAVRNPNNHMVRRLALEMKVSLFEGINNAFQQPQRQRADVLFACTTLMFAMDVRIHTMRVSNTKRNRPLHDQFELTSLQIIEHGIDRWNTHFSGALKLLASSGGMEKFASYYPHLKLPLSATLHFETMLVVLSPVSIDAPKLASRHGLKSLCFDPKIRENFFVTCPLRLIRAIHDTAVCTQNILKAHDRPSAADSYTREWILSDVLRFRPEEGTEDIKKTYYSGKDM
jgi:hypothetical protein